MLSLGNAFSEEDLINFEKKNKKLFIFIKNDFENLFIVLSLKLMEYLLL